VHISLLGSIGALHRTDGHSLATAVVDTIHPTDSANRHDAGCGGTGIGGSRFDEIDSDPQAESGRIPRWPSYKQSNCNRARRLYVESGCNANVPPTCSANIYGAWFSQLISIVQPRRQQLEPYKTERCGRCRRGCIFSEQ